MGWRVSWMHTDGGNPRCCMQSSPKSWKNRHCKQRELAKWVLTRGNGAHSLDQTLLLSTFLQTLGYYCRVGSNRASASESWADQLHQKKKKDKCEIVILPYQELNTVSYAVYIPLFSPINKTLFMQSTDSCLYIKRISLLSTRKLSFHFSKLLDEHLSLEVTPRIWTQPLLPVKPWQKGYASKWILSFLSLPKASNSSFSYIQAAWCPVKTIH